MNSEPEHDEKNTETDVNDAALVAAEVAPARPVEHQTPTPPRQRVAADTYAVGVHVMKLAPAWLLAMSVCLVLSLLLLSWVRPGANASGEPSTPNDSKAAPAQVPVKSNQATRPEPVAARETDASAHAAPATSASNPTTPTTSEAARPAEVSKPVEAAATSDAHATPSSQPDAAQGASANVPSTAEQQFTVQASSHTDESSANEQVSALRAAGFDARSVEVQLPGRGRWYRVQSGRFADRAEAAKELSRIRSKGLAPSAIVVPAQD